MEAGSGDRQAGGGQGSKPIAARCRELGIPERFAPRLDLSWHRRVYGNMLESRRKELRNMAQTQITAIGQKAIVQIELSCLDAQTQLAMASLTSEAARGFVDRLPSIDTLMPRLSFAEVAGEADPPIVEQLMSPNALRQRRFRERHSALKDPSRNCEARNVTEALQGTLRDDIANEPAADDPNRDGAK